MQPRASIPAETGMSHWCNWEAHPNKLSTPVLK